MPTLIERIEADYKTAMKAGDRVRIDALRLIKAGVQRVAIEKRQPQLDDQGVAQVITQQAKQRRETIESAKSAGRQDILTQAEAELALLTAYLPQQLSEEALRKLVEEAVGVAGPSQGPVMKYVMSKAAGAAEGKLVSRLVAERLSKPA
jgi:uncharacterized protein YqeY